MRRRPAAYVPSEEALAAIDVERVRQFGHCEGRILGLLCAMVGFLAISIWIVLNADDPDMTAKALVAGWLGVLILPPFLLWFVALAILGRGVVLELSPAGLRDRRASEDVMAWTSIVEVVPVGRGKDTAIALRMADRVAETLTPSGLSRFWRPAGRPCVGPDRTLTIGLLDVRPERLADLIVAYHRRFGLSG